MSVPVSFLSFIDVTNLENQPYAFLMQHHDAIGIEAKRLKLILEQLSAPNQNDAGRIAQYRAFQVTCEQLLTNYDTARKVSAEKSWFDTMHDNLIMMHLYRILLSFTRLTDELLARIMNDTKWFDTLNQSIASIFDFDQSISILTVPTVYLNVLSFSVLGLRFLIQNMRILKHTFFPVTDSEKAAGAWARFCHEIYQYRFNLANDLVWATINALSNFPGFFNVSAPVANGLIMVCVCFDLSMMIYQDHLANQAYEAYVLEYQHAKHQAVQAELLAQLAFDRVKTTSELQLSLLGVTALVTGVTLLVTASIPIIAPLGSFLCLVGTALYAVTGNYSDYRQKAYIAEQFQTPEAIQAKKDACHKTWTAFIKHVTLPPILFGALALSWPIGLLLIVACCLFEYSQTKSIEKPAALPLPVTS